MLEGIGFGWAAIGFAVKSLLNNDVLSSRRPLLTHRNFVGYSCSKKRRNSDDSCRRKKDSQVLEESFSCGAAGYSSLKW